MNMRSIENMGKPSFQALVQQAGNATALAVEGAKLDFAIGLAKLLNRAGLSRSEFATRLGVSLPMVTKILRGDTNVTIETMAKAACAAQGRLHINLAPADSQCRWFEIVKTERQRVASVPALAVTTPADRIIPWDMVSSDETESVAA
jgi:transcriptional regulator with XRE-family HTH domain